MWLMVSEQGIGVCRAHNSRLRGSGGNAGEDSYDPILLPPEPTPKPKEGPKNRKPQVGRVYRGRFEHNFVSFPLIPYIILLKP